MGLTVTLLIATVVVLVGIVAVRVTTRIGLPSLLLYLAFGVLLGVATNWHEVDLAKDLGTLALVVILAEGGLTTRWRDVKPFTGLGIALSTIAVAVSVLIMAGFMMLVLGTSWQVAVVTGAIISSTDAAAVFSVLRGLGLPSRITAALELESGLNDAPVILLVTFLSVEVDDGDREILGVVERVPERDDVEPRVERRRDECSADDQQGERHASEPLEIAHEHTPDVSHMDYLVSPTPLRVRSVTCRCGATRRLARSHRYGVSECGFRGTPPSSSPRSPRGHPAVCGHGVFTRR
ncbi:MAG: cation:proton antiporter, partial [Cumulibacter sp.]